ncbi:hypothetical protein [Flaviaesturariibacter amylovorans]|uniref:Type 1 periplasmic binding fold superfamily protein n=1 Tax=Flaviaesturariibacter amylovorans TaxID=1084520 RepID=A0ABP8HNZ6_9BACT
MKQRFLKFGLLAFGAAALTLASCKKDNDDGETNDEEVITTLELTFTPQGGGTALTFDYDDPDGPGGSNPTTDAISLAPNTTYNVSARILNKLANPDEDLTGEVEEESEAHRFYYVPAGNVTVTNLDTDGAGLPLGLASTWTTGAAGAATVQVTLRHYPGNPPNKAANDPVNSPKSATDIEASFPVTIQ